MLFYVGALLAIVGFQRCARPYVRQTLDYLAPKAPHPSPSGYDVHMRPASSSKP